MYLRHLIAGLAPQPVARVGIDCKRGVELAPFAARLSALATDPAQAAARLSALATDPAQAAALLPVLIQEMEDRYDLIKARQGIAPGTPYEDITSDIWGLPEHERPVPVVLFIDEVAELFLTASRKDEDRRDEMVTQLIRLAQLGRDATRMLPGRSGRRPSTTSASCPGHLSGSSPSGPACPSGTGPWSTWAAAAACDRARSSAWPSTRSTSSRTRCTWSSNSS
ncbi:hypothetical protein GCM10010238_55060 [Streptomyces griseoviridis]|uniref:FtsK domain-containing protein n=1 Tax=Streptomyces griseoviridis TaxID=45398 RepID=A0A918LJX6_STRGD|nr:hypothetical protein GCM10010238_55060 [Streptomyces niveoruber]